MVFLFIYMQIPGISILGKVHKIHYCVFAALLFHMLCYLFWGMYYGEHTDKFFTAYIDGSFDRGITKPLFYNYGYYTVISQVMAWFYAVMPSINWYGVISQLLFVHVTGGLFFIFLTLYRAFKPLRFFLLLSVLSLIPFWGYHVVLYHTTEQATLACGVGAIGLILSFVTPFRQNMGDILRVRVYYTLLMVISALIRIEPVLLCSVILVPYISLVAFRQIERKALLIVAASVVIIIGGAYLMYLSGIGPGGEQFREIRVYTHTIWDFGQEDSHLRLDSAADSVKLEAARRYFISDPYEMNWVFYEKIGVTALEKSLGSFTGYLKDLNYRLSKAITIWQYLVTSEWVQFAAFSLLFIGLSLALLYTYQWRSLLQLLCFQLWFWAMLFGVTIFMKMELRVLSPHITLNLLTLIWLTIYWLSNNYGVKMITRSILLLALLGFLLTGVWRTQQLNNVAMGYAADDRNIRAFKKELLAEHKDKTMVFNSIAWQLLYADLFDNNELLGKLNMYAFDNGELFMYPSYKQTMKAWCGSDSLGVVGQYMIDNKEDILIVSSDERMQLIEKYMQTVYQLSFNAQRIFPNSKLSKPASGDAYTMPEHLNHHSFSYFVLQ